MSTPIPNINNASKEDLIRELSSRSLEPTTTSHALRSQARAYNKALKMPTISEKDMDSSDSDSESRTVNNPTIIKQTKIIYRESPSTNFDNWKLKFNGKSNVREFLLLLKEKCRTRNISQENLVRVFPELLDGLALIWFRSIYREDLEWEELSRLLIKQFEPNDLQTDLKIKLFNMRQPKDMSVLEFTLNMRALNNMLDAKLPENELLKLAKKALSPKYTNLLVSRDIDSFEQLTTHAGNLESLLTSDKEFASSSAGFDISDNKNTTNKVERYVPSSKPNFNNNDYRRPSYNYRQPNKQNNSNINNNYYSSQNQSSPNKSHPANNEQGRSRTFTRKVTCQFCNIPGHSIENCRKKAALPHKNHVGALNNVNSSEKSKN